MQAWSKKKKGTMIPTCQGDEMRKVKTKWEEEKEEKKNNFISGLQSKYDRS
jgi:hypothetical protein